MHFYLDAFQPIFNNWKTYVNQEKPEKKTAGLEGKWDITLGKCSWVKGGKHCKKNLITNNFLIKMLKLKKKRKKQTKFIVSLNPFDDENSITISKMYPRYMRG